MTDETTARDLAIELRSVAVDIGADWPVSAEILRDAATELDRLRALAGAPTADVAAIEWYCEAGCDDVHFDVNVTAEHEVCGTQVGHRVVPAAAPDAGYVRSCLVDVDDLRRALDGDTTEEKR